MNPRASVWLAVALATMTRAPFALADSTDESPTRWLVIDEAVLVLEPTTPCLDLVVRTAPDVRFSLETLLVDGSHVTRGRTGIGRLVERVCNAQMATLFAHVVVDRPARVEVGIVPANGDAPVASDGVETTIRRSVGPNVVASAPRRVGAAVERLVARGYAVASGLETARLTDVTTSIPVPPGVRGCSLLAIAPSGSDVDVGGSRVRRDGIAELTVCGEAGLAVAVRSVASTATVAYAFVASEVRSDPRAPPGRAAIETEWRARGLRVDQVFALRRVTESPTEVAFRASIPSGRCAAFAVVSSRGRSAMRLVDASGTLVTHSSSASPAPRVYACAAERPFEGVLRIEVDARADSAEILVAGGTVR